MKHLISSAALALSALLFSGCADKPLPAPVASVGPFDIFFDFNMKGLNGSATTGSFGVAATESDAQAAKPTLLGGTITWAETNGGKLAKRFVLPSRPKGEKLWVFVTTNQPLSSGQSLSLAWNTENNVSLSTSTPAVVVKEFTVVN